MKISKLLSKNILPILILFFLIISENNILAEEETIDIWKLEKNKKINEKKEKIEIENTDSDYKLIIDFENAEKKNSEIIKDSNLISNINLVGLYDPSDNGLSIDMWMNSDGTEIKRIFNKLNKNNL